MAKPRKKPNAQPVAAGPPRMPLIGDKVSMPRSKSVLEIIHVSRDGDEVDLILPRTNLQWFRVKTDTLTFVDRKPPARTSNRFTIPEPAFDVGEILERVATVQKENLKRIDDDIDILKAYLKTQRAPKAAIEALERPDGRAARGMEEGRRPDQEAARGVRPGSRSSRLTFRVMQSFSSKPGR